MNVIRFARRLSKAAAGAALAVAIAPAAHAVDATATATAKVFAPITIAVGSNLDFGNLARGNGDVTLSTAGARTRTGSLALPTSTGVTAARFDVGGEASSTFSISYAGSSTSLSTGGVSPATMAVTWIAETVSGTGNAVGSTNAANNPTSGTLSTGGAARVFVGGTVTVGATQAAGTYTGSVVVSVDYN